MNGTIICDISSWFLFPSYTGENQSENQSEAFVESPQILKF